MNNNRNFESIEEEIKFIHDIDHPLDLWWSVSPDTYREVYYGEKLEGKAIELLEKLKNKYPSIYDNIINDKFYWRDWGNIENAKNEERDYCGIYRIRMVDNSKKPLIVSRICGMDKEGIIYIGRAKPKDTLGKRIDNFYNVKMHSGAETYELFCKSLKCQKHPYANHNLEYSVIRLHVIENEHEQKLREEAKLYKKFFIDSLIKKVEIDALVKYFITYGELPPCNSNFPGKWEEFVKKLEEY